MDRERAQRIKTLPDVQFPELKHWNYAPCEHHDTPQVACVYRKCGGDFFAHQRVGIAWFYAVERGLLADSTGLGKSNEILGLIALLKEREKPYRTLIVAQPSAVKQWVAEANRFIPGIRAGAGEGTKNERYDIYDTDWELLVINNSILIRDYEYLNEAVPFDVLVADDVDPIRNSTRTSTAFYLLSQKVEKCYVLNATPLAMRLEDLYRTAEPLGGRTIFGSLSYFQRRYIQRSLVTVVIPTKQQVKNPKTGRKQRTRKVWQATGYQEIDDFKRKFSPIFLRRTYDDVAGDLSIPEIAPPTDVWMDLHPAQRHRYNELQNGVMTILKEHGEEVNQVTALTAFLRGSQICAGLSSLGEPDGEGTSIKLDWIERQLQGDWEQEKIVVFTKFKGIVSSLLARCEALGVGAVPIWGEANATERARDVKRFWEDPNCRVLVGTTALERSLNLQNSRIFVNVDRLLNPAREVQKLGRVRRLGSQHSRVFTFNLLIRDSQEEGYASVLAARSAISDSVWNEENQLFEQLSPSDLLRLIRP